MTLVAARALVAVGNTPGSSIVAASKNTPGSSIVKAGRNTPGSSTIDPRLTALERERAIKRVHHADLCRLAGLDREHWRLLRKGRVQPTDRTLENIRKVLAGLGSPVPLDTVAATHRLAMMWLAQATGADVEVMMAQDFSCERPRDPVWLRASRLRRYAIYVTAVELEIRNSVLAKAIGCSRQNVQQAREWVEEMRDDKKLEDLLDRCAVLCTGRRP